jgi:DNA sulfur modification protein DndC
LVVDKTTPSCGNSRFGCWVCTVVTRDSSMEAMIDNGAEWLEPLLKYRDLLASTQDPLVKLQVRDLKRRNGQVMPKADGGFIPGPYKPKTRKDLLRRLLETERLIRRDGPNPEERLISKDELEAIRRIWRAETQDWEDSVPKIYREVTGEDLDWATDEQPVFSTEERRLLDDICARHQVPSAMVAKLLDIERELHGMSRRSSVNQKLSSVFDEDWRSEEEITNTDSKRAS